MRLRAPRSRLILLALFGVSLAMLLLPGEHALALRGQALSLARPILWLFHDAARSGAPATASIQVPSDGAERTTEPVPPPAVAPADLDRLRVEQARLRDENQRLRAMLGAAAPPDGRILPPGLVARVIARETLWQEPILALDRGAGQGVRDGAGVLYRGAVLGRIVAPGRDASCMALLTHRGVRVAARLADCRLEGVLQGTKDTGGERLCRLKVVARDLPAKNGELVVTSGLDGCFPPGCWLGTVTAIERADEAQWELTVLPACVPQSVEAVFVLKHAPCEIPWPADPGARRREGR